MADINPTPLTPRPPKSVCRRQVLEVRFILGDGVNTVCREVVAFYDDDGTFLAAEDPEQDRLRGEELDKHFAETYALKQEVKALENSLGIVTRGRDSHCRRALSLERKVKSLQKKLDALTQSKPDKRGK